MAKENLWMKMERLKMAFGKRINLLDSRNLLLKFKGRIHYEDALNETIQNCNSATHINLIFILEI